MLSAEYPPFPIHRLRRRWLIVWLTLWALSSVIYALWIGPHVIASNPANSRIQPLTGLLSPLTTALPSLALALPLAIWSLSPLPARVLFRPTRARVIGALGLWLFFPLGMIGPLPVTAGWSLLVAPHVLTGLALPAFCYLIACLLSSGLPRRGLRTWAYLMIYVGAVGSCVAAGTAFWRLIL